MNMSIYQIKIEKSDVVAFIVAIACAAYLVPKWANHVRGDDERAIEIAECMDGNFSRAAYEACTESR
jgi:hypothetical protein